MSPDSRTGRKAVLVMAARGWGEHGGGGECQHEQGTLLDGTEASIERVVEEAVRSYHGRAAGEEE